jgi:hypothetical protein
MEDGQKTPIKGRYKRLKEKCLACLICYPELKEMVKNNE